METFKNIMLAHVQTTISPQQRLKQRIKFPLQDIANSLNNVKYRSEHVRVPQLQKPCEHESHIQIKSSKVNHYTCLLQTIF